MPNIDGQDWEANFNLLGELHNQQTKKIREFVKTNVEIAREKMLAGDDELSWEVWMVWCRINHFLDIEGIE